MGGAAGRPGRPARVVVIGASLAGCCAAAAVAAAGTSVTLLERDELPAEPQPRPGVPQGGQPHVFLYRGLLALEELLPGIRAQLLDLGAVAVDTGDVAWLAEPGWLATGQPSYEVFSASRSLVEQVVRERACALPGVGIRTGARVTGLGRRGRRWTVRLADGGVEVADLVVDASGRTSRLPVWLAEIGVGPAPTSEIDAGVGYATRRYAAGAPGGPPGIVIQQTPATLAGGIALPVENGEWLVAAIGCGDNRPPRDVEGFRAFLRRLRDPALDDLVFRAMPVGDIAVHRRTGNIRRHYERVRRWPDGLLVLGDSLCAFNPVYGQGVTVAAAEAAVLRRAIDGGLAPGYAHRVLRQFSRVVALPWAVATGEDLRYPTSAGSQALGQALLGRWTRELARQAVHGNLRSQAVVSRVYHLMGSPLLLFHPALVAAAIRGRLAGRPPLLPRPAGLSALVEAP